MNITENGLAINKRFFHTIDVLKQMRKIRGLQTFTRRYNLNYGNMYITKSDPEHRGLKPEWLAFLVLDFGVSAKYLLTGIGPMFEGSKTNVK